MRAREISDKKFVEELAKTFGTGPRINAPDVGPCVAFTDELCMDLAQRLRDLASRLPEQPA